MSTEIGDVEIPFISSIETDREVPFTEVKDLHQLPPKVVTHQPDSERVSIDFIISELVHSEELSVEDQRIEIMSLAEEHPSANRIDYREWDGWLAVTDINFERESGEPAIQGGTLDAIYLPYEDYNDVF